MSRNWGYVEYDTIYKSSELMTRQLLEIVSKGGNLLLNNGPTPKGEITKAASDGLAEMGYWMNKNSEGIYGASPWKISNELLTEITQNSEDEKSDKENTMKDAENDVTSKLIFPEVSFTTKDGFVYAYVASATEPDVMIKAFALDKLLKIKAVKMLGTEQKVTWTQTANGLSIKLPQYSENEIPITGYQIELN